MSNYLTEMDIEIKKRIKLMEDPAYEKVPRMPKSDATIAGITCVVLIIGLIVTYIRI